ncbi:hypothetical protein FYC62_02095 [Pedobacter aquae]|uniref:Uncharacterized protein n=1 Tax=Pedobacter aquae TaxID=2605747 RepID=A0A5C0VFC1_9SPHI|nr:hypothetical protein [Pedobacter aquae]QEK50592.1 hypothetical protein FYC62_02095 [Pedobacter aquae]
MKNKKETQIKQENQDEITAEIDLKEKQPSKKVASMKDFTSDSEGVKSIQDIPSDEQQYEKKSAK